MAKSFKISLIQDICRVLKDTALLLRRKGFKWAMSSHIANEKFFLMNRQLSEKYFDALYPVRFYQNASLALFDVASSLQQFLAHKAYFAVAKNGSSLIESLSPI